MDDSYIFIMKGEKNPLHMLAWILLIIGGLNWGLVGAADLDLVQLILGGVPWLADLVYILVGLSALLGIAKMAGMKK